MGHTGFDSIILVITHVGKARKPLNTCKQLNGTSKEARVAEGEAILASVFANEEVFA
jgi:hypothetical protein